MNIFRRQVFVSSNKCSSFVKCLHNCDAFQENNKTLSDSDKSKQIKQTVHKAEKIVGYSTSFLNLKWLLSEEIATLSSSLGKLVGTDHPLLSTAKSLFVNQEQPTWALIVLLMSKAETININNSQDIDKDSTGGILHTQRMVAEITELIKSGISFHKSLINQTGQEANFKDVQQGNKLALLVGDYLITKSYEVLAGINNDQVELIISSALRDICEAEFLGERDAQNNPLPSMATKTTSATISAGEVFTVEPVPIKDCLGNAGSEWTMRHFLGGASLLGKSCLSAVKLGGQSDHLQEEGYKFGRHLALSFQADREINNLINDIEDSLILVSAPVMFHMENDASLCKEINCDNIDITKIRDIVKTGSGMEKAIQLRDFHKQHALLALGNFCKNESTNTLKELVQAL